MTNEHSNYLLEHQMHIYHELINHFLYNTENVNVHKVTESEATVQTGT